MRQKEKQSLRALNAEERHKRRDELEAEILAWRRDRSTKQIKNHREAREKRKMLAVLKTFDREMQLEVSRKEGLV
ncbi:hypothetical protein M1555_01475 [Patescibacteria group bacterium]|nr:hypothetical protein [Patescibacteria group bacterium]